MFGLCMARANGARDVAQVAYNSSMSWFKPKSFLDFVFATGIILKGLNGFLEIVGGLLLLVVPLATINGIVVGLTQNELSEDPNGLIASHLLSAVHGLTSGSMLFLSFYLLSHGIVKAILVVAVLKNKIWAYPWMIVFLGLFIAYQLYLMTSAATGALVALTVFDGFIAWLTYMEYRKLRPATEGGPPSS
jgi:uncharacterized membrane protein